MLLLERAEPDRPDRGRRPRRRWVVPPAPAFRRQPFEGAYVLDEVRGPTGLVLFYLLRAVELWSGLSPKERIGLFAESETGALPPYLEAACKEEPQIATSLRRIAGLLKNPVTLDPAFLSTACCELSDWACSHAFLSTALDFAEAAAAAQPDDSWLAFRAGRLCRIRSDYERAKHWFVRAVALARRANDLAARADVFLGWGVMEQQRGRKTEARKMFARAWRAAKRGKLKAHGAAARHNLIALTDPGRPVTEGCGHIAAALRLYGPSDPAVIRLCGDVAAYLSWHGYFSLSLPIYERVLARLSGAMDRAVVLSNIARAAGAVAKPTRFFSAWNELSGPLGAALELLPAALIELAAGAWSLGHKHQALTLLRRGRDTASLRGETGVVAECEALRIRIEAGERPTVNRDPPHDVQELATQVIHRLEVTAAPVEHPRRLTES